VATRVPGCVDSVDDGVTGILVDVRDSVSLAAAIAKYLADPSLRLEHGRAGRERALRDFRPEPIWEQSLGEYQQLLAGRPAKPRRVLAKRLLDVLVSTLFLAALGPVMAIVAAAVRATLGSPVLFRQTRPGFGGKPFTIFKFRTMRSACNATGTELPDSQRLTAFGRWLRSSSLDETPALWNVIRGELSLVGPRPLLLEYLPRYSAQQGRRHEVKPGITGWAQVNGRNGLNWDRKLELDVWYVDHQCMALDLKILWLTLRTVLSRSGVAQPGHSTMPKFMGSSPEAH
jgi:lipopolysaccharide/colanic/teichoic acid biosynthesis glycosyltransferase